MPSIEANLASWNRDWGHDGSDWSSAWGSTAAMWRGSVLARIAPFVPTGALLEIAPGRGRLTEHLLPLCTSYVGIDLAPACVAACRERFADVGHARFAPTDGKTLPGVDDASVDFAFSWDSLVHAAKDVLRAYVGELARVLRPGASAFVHHSNLAAFVDGDTGKLTVENPHWRDPTVSAELVRQACREHGLSCHVQELVQWGVPYHNDCFTLLQRPTDGAVPSGEPVHKIGRAHV